jgi:hypothetical protein
VEVERLGEQYLLNRQQIVDTDRQRNAVREALTAVRKPRDGAPKTWMQTSSTGFLRYATPDAVQWLERGAVKARAGEHRGGVDVVHRRRASACVSMVPAAAAQSLCHCRPQLPSPLVCAHPHRGCAAGGAHEPAAA